MRLIDADALIERIQYSFHNHERVRIDTVTGTFLSEYCSPTIDAVPIVRCKDCKFGDWDSEPHDAMVCMRTKDGFWRSGNDFCSFGEQKEGAANG